MSEWEKHGSEQPKGMLVRGTEGLHAKLNYVLDHTPRSSLNKLAVQAIEEFCDRCIADMQRPHTVSSWMPGTRCRVVGGLPQNVGATVELVEQRGGRWLFDRASRPLMTGEGGWITHSYQGADFYAIAEVELVPADSEDEGWQAPASEVDALDMQIHAILQDRALYPASTGVAQ